MPGSTNRKNRFDQSREQVRPIERRILQNLIKAQ